MESQKKYNYDDDSLFSFSHVLKMIYVVTKKMFSLI